MRKNKNGYVPHPIDTTGVSIPEELHDLVELLAKNTHEVWAVGKMKAGYVFGETVSNDPADLRHPDLRPYNELTDAEKAYDINTSMETVKLLLALGWTISPPEK